MKRRGRNSFALLGAALLGGAALVVGARAAAFDTAVHAFDIPAQPASNALPEFARQAGRQIIAPGEYLRSIRTPAVQGQLDVATALGILIKDTGLVVVSDDGHMIILARRAAQAANADERPGERETVIVTGYRASLTGTATAKQRSVAMLDAVFAENIGRFPDANVAEAFNRIPGITISREIDGSGVNVSVRGLGANFTKVLLNDAQVAIASTGPTNFSNANREVDLNLFPVELFTQLAVLKSPQASRLEGGTAGTINMRSVRPFDNPGLHLTYSLKSVVLDNQGSFGPNAALIASGTHGSFGALLGVTTMSTRFFTRGVESAGWTTPNLLTDGPVVQCAPAPSCNTLGGGNWTIPAVVPANVSFGTLLPGQTLDQARLLQLNPGLSLSQLNNMLLPRLGRPFMEKGVRSRYNGVASFEYRPNDALHLYLDMIGGRISNKFDRADIDWVVRNGGAIPTALSLYDTGVVKSGTFLNAQWLMEGRPYHEYGDFFSVNPGLEWNPSQRFHLTLQANASRSHFLRDVPTILVASAPNAGYSAGAGGPAPVAGGIVVNYRNDGSYPSLDTNVDLNDPANFTWSGGRVNVNAEKRYSYTNGFHLDAQFGGEELAIKTGFAFDAAHRDIAGYDNSQAWQNAVCGDNPSAYLPNPNRQPSCLGATVIGSTAAVAAAIPGYPTYAGYGTGYSAGFAPLNWSGSLIPQARLASYLHRGPAGFVLVDYDALFRDAHYRDFAYPNAPMVVSTNLAVGAGAIDEKSYGLYAEANGTARVLDRPLNYNAGVRVVWTLQSVAGPVSTSDPRNSAGGYLDGGKYPNTVSFIVAKRQYWAVLPSANLRYDLSDDWILRLALSRTMTRPNPSFMLPGVNFSDPSAALATVGSPGLAPYYSNNVDFGAEYYSGGEGLLGVALFRKSVTGFTATTTTTRPFAFLSASGITYDTLTPTQQAGIDLRGGPSAATIQVAQVVNVDRALDIDGVEINWVQPLDAVLSPFDLAGFGFRANATFVGQSSGGGAIATGVPSFSYNFTAYYERDAVSLRTAYVFNGAAAFTDSNQNGLCLPNIASITCPGGARIYNRAYGQLDFSGSLKLSALFGELPSDPQLLLDVQNLTRSKLRSYFQFREAPYASYAAGTTYMFGLRGMF